jgi:hypothetical protein
VASFGPDGSVSLGCHGLSPIGKQGRRVRDSWSRMLFITQRPITIVPCIAANKVWFVPITITALCSAFRGPETATSVTAASAGGHDADAGEGGRASASWSCSSVAPHGCSATVSAGIDSGAAEEAPPALTAARSVEESAWAPSGAAGLCVAVPKSSRRSICGLPAAVRCPSDRRLSPCGGE